MDVEEEREVGVPGNNSRAHVMHMHAHWYAHAMHRGALLTLIGVHMLRFTNAFPY